jgi:hypothetical protein
VSELHRGRIAEQLPFDEPGLLLRELIPEIAIDPLLLGRGQLPLLQLRVSILVPHS